MLGQDNWSFPTYEPKLRRLVCQWDELEQETEAQVDALEIDKEEDLATERDVCDSGGYEHETKDSCGEMLSTFQEYDAQYATHHKNRCEVCFRSFASSRLLGIHVQERHDSFFAVKVARKEKVFECLTDGCLERFYSRRSRRRHLIQVHAYPEDFYIVGIEDKNRPKHEKNSKNAEPMEEDKPQIVPIGNSQLSRVLDGEMDSEMEALTNSFASKLSAPLGYGFMRTTKHGRPKPRLDTGD